MRKFLGMFALALGAALPASAQQSRVYHMANPGHDIFNTQADDVFAP